MENNKDNPQSVIRVLIVDDSAYVRKVVERMLTRSPFIEVVGKARNGREALEMVEELNPDVVTLDLIMPEKDGVAFLKEQMTRKPVKVIVVSIASEGGERYLEALNAGAVDFIQKPTALATDKILEISDELIAKVKSTAMVDLEHLRVLSVDTAPEPYIPDKLQAKGDLDIVVIGISTGGPQALRYLIPQFPSDFAVPIVMVLHMPEGYTQMYAEKLNEISRIQVKEAREGDVPASGLALLAPAGHHLTFVRNTGDRVSAHLDKRPFDKPHRPSVDVLFKSAADIFKNRVLGVVMTGMGSDGKEGAAWIKSQGGLIFTEAEETCVVYGMPRTVDESGLSDQSVRLDHMAKAIVESIYKGGKIGNNTGR